MLIIFMQRSKFEGKIAYKEFDSFYVPVIGNHPKKLRPPKKGINHNPNNHMSSN